MNGILNHDEIVELINTGVIEGADLKNVNPASLNVRLGNKFLIEARNHNGYDGQFYDPLKFALRQSPSFIEVEGGITLGPGDFCLASLVEKVNLPSDLCCDVMLRSSAARMGIQHLLAGWGDPGYSGHLTLELKNELKYHQVRLVGGDAIIQLRFHRINAVAEGKDYGAKGGKYSGDTGPQVVKKEHGQ
jgi:dCTP deaminase